MKKAILFLAIVVVGCKWRYDKVVKPEEKMINDSMITIGSGLKIPEDEPRLTISIDSIRGKIRIINNRLTLTDSDFIEIRGVVGAYIDSVTFGNHLDSGKGYIFRKYQNKPPKKHHWFPGMESTEGYKEACEAMDSTYNSIKIN